MTTIADKANAFSALHVPGEPFVIPNPWDAGTARMLAGIGFEALATTSAGFAYTLGLNDGHITRDQALEHSRDIAAAVDVPISADLENGFAEAPDAVAETYRLAAATGIVGASIEDSTGNPEQPIYDFELAVTRVEAAVAAVRGAEFDFTLTARSENFLHGRADLDDTIARLAAFEAAGADVLYAPGLPDLDAVATVCAAVTRPVNVLVVGALAQHSVSDFASAGAARLSLGSVLARHVLGHLFTAASEIQDQGTFSLASVMGGRDQIDRFMC
jgi:2-methylisocitrate lyase-like PEP mutase family enzyme